MLSHGPERVHACELKDVEWNTGLAQPAGLHLRSQARSRLSFSRLTVWDHGRWCQFSKGPSEKC